jgi:hypothetical protein
MCSYIQLFIAIPRIRDSSQKLFFLALKAACPEVSGVALLRLENLAFEIPGFPFFPKLRDWAATIYKFPFQFYHQI